jgi:hypothetical protein
MSGAISNAAQRPPSTSSWPSTRNAGPALGAQKLDHPESQTRQSSFPELGQQLCSRELIWQTILDSNVPKFRKSISSSARVSSDASHPSRATNAWAMGGSVDDVPALPSLGGVVRTMDTTTYALPPMMVRTYSRFWPQRLLRRKRPLRTRWPPIG